MRDFILSHSQSETAKDIFAELFDDDISVFSRILGELEDVAKGWREPRHLKRDTVVFATLVDPFHNSFEMAYPLSDVSKIKIEDIPAIPEYMRRHSFTDELGEVDYQDFIRFARPLLLTTSEELMEYWVYVIEDEPMYDPALLAGIVYEMSLLGSSIEISDRRKEELTDELSAVKEAEGLGMSVEELLVESGLSHEPEVFPDEEVLDSFYLSRYNARLAMYERLHFDIVSSQAKGEILER